MVALGPAGVPAASQGERVRDRQGTYGRGATTTGLRLTGEQFGHERTAEAIRAACDEGLSAEATIDRLLADVAAFRGAAPQSDDMACVVVRVEGEVDTGEGA